jgi:hypothetical protein
MVAEPLHPGLTKAEALEFRELMTPEVGPQMTSQQRLDRVSRLKDLQKKVDNVDDPEHVDEVLGKSPPFDPNAVVEIPSFKTVDTELPVDRLMSVINNVKGKDKKLQGEMIAKELENYDFFEETTAIVEEYKDRLRIVDPAQAKTMFDDEVFGGLILDNDKVADLIIIVHELEEQQQRKR